MMLYIFTQAYGKNILFFFLCIIILVVIIFIFLFTYRVKRNTGVCEIIYVYALILFQEYILGNKKLSIIPVAFSLMSSFMCATSMFGLAAENYLRGTHFMVINLSNIIGTPIVTYVFLPVFYKLEYLSVYQVQYGFRENASCSIEKYTLLLS